MSAVLLGALASPAFRDVHEDGFPLSTYPMFATRRGREHELMSARAIAADGSEARVPATYIANAETMQAIGTLTRAIRAGEREALELCEKIASRLRDAREPVLRSAVRVELVTERVDAIDYLGGHGKALDAHVHARCLVRRAP